MGWGFSVQWSGGGRRVCSLLRKPGPGGHSKSFRPTEVSAHFRTLAMAPAGFGPEMARSRLLLRIAAAGAALRSKT